MPLPKHLPLIGRGPAVSDTLHPLWSIGFRPFFLLAACAATLLIPCWLALLFWGPRWTSPFMPPIWHAHEMLFGYTVAVIAGFLLTAAQTWTGQVTARGGSLLALCVLWCLGRIAAAIGVALPALVPATIDVAFLPLLALVIARPIARARDRRNAGMPVVLLVLAIANAMMWIGSLRADFALTMRGERLALDLIALLIVVIGGRIIPSFTANAVKGLHVRQRSFMDKLGIGSMLAALVADVVAPGSHATAGCAALAASVNALRLWGWGGSRTLSQPLLWVLHLGFGCTAAAIGLHALSMLSPMVSRSAATHLLTVGGIGVLTFGMMARVALGHTGRPLTLRRSTALALGLIPLSAFVRVVGPVLLPDRYLAILLVAGAAWTLAFVLYIAGYAHILFAPRADAAGSR